MCGEVKDGAGGTLGSLHGPERKIGVHVLRDHVVDLLGCVGTESSDEAVQVGCDVERLASSLGVAE